MQEWCLSRLVQMILILSLSRLKNRMGSQFLSVGEVGAEPRSFYGRAVSAMTSLTAK